LPVWWFVANATSARFDHWNWPILFAEGPDEHEPERGVGPHGGKLVLWPAGTPLARRHAREARKGDVAVGYTAGEGWRCITALLQVVEGGVEGPTRWEEGKVVRELDFSEHGRKVSVLLEARVLLPEVGRVPRSRLLLEPELSGAQPLRNRWGSIFKLTDAEWATLLPLLMMANPDLDLPFL
jgi:hypothetical protein